MSRAATLDVKHDMMDAGIIEMQGQLARMQLPLFLSSSNETKSLLSYETDLPISLLRRRYLRIEDIVLLSVPP